MAVNPETSVGKVRILISDVGGEDSKTFLFQDNEIEVFLTLEDQDIYLAAATALLTIAGNEAQLLKAITVLELETDGSKTAKALKELAEKFEEKSDNNVPFEIARLGTDIFGRRQMREHVAEGVETDQGWEE